MHGGDAMSSETAEKKPVEKLTVLAAAIEGVRVLFPDVMVAEIVDFQSLVSEDEETPTWYLGKLPWREITVPLISLEAMNSDSFFRKKPDLKIVVVHSAYLREQMPYWSFVVNETPRMLRLNRADVHHADTGEKGKIEAMHAEISGDLFLVPDAVKIEKNIVDWLGHVASKEGPEPVVEPSPDLPE